MQALTPPNPFTISDMSHVWIICDVWENNMAQVHIGRVCRHPSGRLSGPGLESPDQQHPADYRPDHSHREGPAGSGESGSHAASACSSPRPSTARRWNGTRPCRPPPILHLHDRDWVYTPSDDGHFRRVEVVAGTCCQTTCRRSSPDIKPGDQVVCERSGVPEHGGAIGKEQQ